MAEAAVVDSIETRGIFSEVEVRAVDADERSATFVAATENGVETWFGTEYLRMRGADLARYKRNPVVLDTHNRYEAGAVIGKAKVRAERSELIAEVTFAETQRAEEIWQLVQGGFLKAMSIGFVPKAGSVQVIGEDENAKLGGKTVEGPARIVREWQLFEVSVVPVPADAEALRRSFLEGGSTELTREVRCLVGAVNRLLEQEVNEMPKEPKPNSVPAKEEADANATKTREAEPLTELKVKPEPLAVELQTRSIRALCPRGLEPVADQCVLEGLSVEDARKRMLAEHVKRNQPVGTPSVSALEPDADGADAEGGDDKPTKLEDVDDKTLVRSICG